MSLRINHNLAALNAHRNLVQTNSDLSRSMQRLSSGFRINQGSDNPAGLVISEQFRAQIAGLNRAVENSEGSINMIQTAEGALTEINSLLVSRSRRILVSILFRQNSALAFGHVPCLGHPCQKQPSTNTTARLRVKIISGCPSKRFPTLLRYPSAVR